MKKKYQQLSLFWCSLLRPVLYEEIPEKEHYQFLKNLSEQAVRFPNGSQKKPSLSTLKRKLALYSQDGFEALSRKPRSDKGLPRKVTPSVIETAVSVKRDQGERSAATINLFLKDRHNTTVPRSTLYRHLKAHGATKLKLGIVKEKVRCRWTREKPNELWVGDFSDGPYVLGPEAHVVQSHLSLFIDCHSRYVVEGRYYLRETFDILIDSLLRAWAVHGLSEDLYLDNAKIYHANALNSACYTLRIKLIHRTANDPSPGGLVERLFCTNQSQFETEVRAGEILTLDALNRAFQAWLHHYHHTVHSEIKRTPAELYQVAVKRRVSVETAVKFFMEEEKRVVHRDFSDVSLHGHFYAVDPRLRGDKVLVRFDSYGSAEKILLYSLDERFLGEGRLYARDEKDRTPKAPPQKKPSYNYIDLIVSKHNEYLEKKARGIDYTALPAATRWPFGAFVSTVAELLGKEGMSAFSTTEIETLRKLYDRHPELTAATLHEAFAAADTKTIGNLAFALQKFKHT